MSTPSASSDSDEVPRKMSRASALSVEAIEPYVRKRRSSADSERLKKRMQCLSEEEQNLMRTNINSRERKRMHDLNDALDDLRASIPYQNPKSRKWSKINTIMFANNWIKVLEQRTEALRRENEELKARQWQKLEQSFECRLTKIQTIPCAKSLQSFKVLARPSCEQWMRSRGGSSMT